MARSFFVLIVIAVINFFRPGNEPGKESSTFTVYINYADYSVRAEVLREPSHIHPQEGCTYYWYSSNDIKSTENGFDGKLLHGQYKSFYRDLNLKEEGKFSHGLKTGIWKTWFTGGKIHEIIHYKNGNKNGVMQVFNTEGKLISETGYKNDKINGRQILYKDGKPDTVLKYRNNELVIKKKRIEKDSINVKTNRKPKGTLNGKRKSSNPVKKVMKNVADSLKKQDSAHRHFKRPHINKESKVSPKSHA